MKSPRMKIHENDIVTIKYYVKYIKLKATKIVKNVRLSTIVENLWHFLILKI